MKDKKVLASVDELQEEGLAGSEDTWSGYHGRQKQISHRKEQWRNKFMVQSLWYRNLLRNPSEISALFPCSTETGNLMTHHLERMGKGYVLELGSGMGAITECILKRQVPEEKLVLVEKNKEFAGYLTQKYQKANVIEEDATELLESLLTLQIREVAHVVCSLPLSLIPPEQQLVILDTVFKLLHPQGCFSLVTYLPSCPISQKILDQYSKSSELFGFTWKNIPPTYVYHLRHYQ